MDDNMGFIAILIAVDTNSAHYEMRDVVSGNLMKRVVRS